MACRLPEHVQDDFVAHVGGFCSGVCLYCKVKRMEEMQSATRVEKNTEQGTIGVDLVIIGAWYRIVAGGVVLSPMYYTKEDAMDAADVILDRLCEGVLLVEAMPEGPEDQAPDFTLDDDRAELTTGWDAQDHKALYD